MVENVKPYDAGSASVDSEGVKIEVDIEIYQLLIYATVNASVSLNDASTKEIFLPKDMWTPIYISRNFACNNFVVTSEEEGQIYWQGWVI